MEKEKTEKIVKLDMEVEDLGYCTTHELWEMLSELGVPYFETETIEKKCMDSEEMIEVPLVTPRTDYENMKWDILFNLRDKDRTTRRNFTKKWGKVIKKRKLQSRGEGNENE